MFGVVCCVFVVDFGGLIFVVVVFVFLDVIDVVCFEFMCLFGVVFE